ncbi:MAG: MerR family transcriptional regulator, partial [Turicibacter sp.]
MNDTQVYTAGIFAKKAGVTLKTIHHYDKAGLLKPSGYSDAGYRLYTDLDFGRLQKILTLKFLGFSLEDIKELVTADSNDSNLNQSLTIQKNIIDEKIKHLSLVRKAIDQTLSMKETHAPHYWGHFINIINVVNSEKICLDQYKNSANLSARIYLHDAYSTNTDGWHNWFFDQLELTNNLKILELGCGKASLWQRNIDKIPKNCEIILSDLSEGMLVEAKYTLADYADIFNFEVMD